LPVSLKHLRLRLTKELHVQRNENGVAEPTMRQPLALLRNGLMAAAVAASCMPNLHELVVQYKEGRVSAAKINGLRCLPAFEALEIGWWASGNNHASCSYCSRTSDGAHVGAPDFGNEDLDFLLAGLPQLWHLSMALRSRMTADALSLAHRRCPFLKHEELRGSQLLPAFPPFDMTTRAIKE
jgi:hypothetical protein